MNQISDTDTESFDWSAEYADRRTRLIESMGENDVAVIAAAPEKNRNNDVTYPYRAASDFRYLTGFIEPKAIAIIAPGHAEGEFQLFCRPRHPEQETWVGRRFGIDGARAALGADNAFDIAEFRDRLPGLLDGRAAVHLALGDESGIDRRVLTTLTGMRSQGRGRVPPARIERLDIALHAMRRTKSAAEIACMRRAADISAAAHIAAMQCVRPGMAEYELAATIHHGFEAAGAHWAYPTIVGAGANGCVLHYIENADVINAGNLVLIDAGAEYAGYAGDITRTFPASGCFNTAQRRLYDVVLAANKAALAAAQPGEPANAPHQAAVAVIVDGLIELGLLTGARDDIIANQDYRAFFMHGTSHWLGMDVHDVGDYKENGEWVTLEPGMAFTVEPGLYIPPETENVPAEYLATGIRIEDDVVITDNGCEVLTADVPKEPDAIERLIANAK
ncbi:aminopeptidase P N-terminal domain-containing protein [Salinisphaera orenii]|uniref:aminopeptidase P N-terminal domain-containing protein n=1 Tax=Salinisphaera orenii TaxID=856731 RepID=UPI000DBE9B67